MRGKDGHIIEWDHSHGPVQKTGEGSSIHQAGPSRMQDEQEQGALP